MKNLLWQDGNEVARTDSLLSFLLDNGLGRAEEDSIVFVGDVPPATATESTAHDGIVNGGIGTRGTAQTSGQGQPEPAPSEGIPDTGMLPVGIERVIRGRMLIAADASPSGHAMEAEPAQDSPRAHPKAHAASNGGRVKSRVAHETEPEMHAPTTRHASRDYAEDEAADEEEQMKRSGQVPWLGKEDKEDDPDSATIISKMLPAKLPEGTKEEVGAKELPPEVEDLPPDLQKAVTANVKTMKHS